MTGDSITAYDLPERVARYDADMDIMHPNRYQMIRVALVDVGDRSCDYESAVARLPNVTFAAAGSLDELLERHDALFDAVVIHSPVSQRRDLARRAAEAGKHVLVDMPIGCSVEDVEAVIEACASAGVHLMVGRPLRSMPYQLAVRESLDAGKLGAPGLLRIHHWNSGAGESTNGDIAELTMGEVDLACWLFDAAPDAVYAVAPKNDVSAGLLGVQLHLGFPDGGMALVDCTRSAGEAVDPYFALTLIGSKGAAYADDHHNANLLFRTEGTTSLNVGQGRDHVWHQLREFVDAIDADRRPGTSGEEARLAAAVVEAAAESLATRRAAVLVGDRYELQ